MNEKLEKCPYCLNEENRYFYLGSKGWYCRKCFNHLRKLEANNEEIKIENSDYNLSFQLTEKQKIISTKIKENYHHHNILVFAACGAGKTEIVLEMISDALKSGLKVGWAIPRRSVVLQLASRLKSYFHGIKVVPVCQGFTNEVFGDLIVCTTHQLYRYYQYFDYLIIDEPDAFPFKNNQLLQNFAITSTKSKHIYLTATPDAFVLERSDLTFQLFERPHKNKIIEPVEIRTISIFNIYYLIKILKKSNKIIVFFPTIKMAEYYNLLFKEARLITSKSEEKEKIIESFLNEEFKILFSTTVLERGVTIPKVDVLVFNADHFVFDRASLIQMTGRVGRSIKYPYGNAYLLTNSRDRKVLECISLIKKMNKNV